MTETYQDYVARMSAAGESYLCESAYNQKYLDIPQLDWPG